MRCVDGRERRPEALNRIEHNRVEPSIRTVDKIDRALHEVEAEMYPFWKGAVSHCQSNIRHRIPTVLSPRNGVSRTCAPKREVWNEESSS